MSKPALIVLAAGFSSRFGQEDKLQARIDGRPLLDVTLSLYARHWFSERLLVLKTGDTFNADIGRAHSCRLVDNPLAHEGLATSIAAGVSALQPDAKGALIALADMPFVSPVTLEQLVRESLKTDGPTILAPSCDDRAGHPKFFSTHFFSLLKQLQGDEGARHILAKHKSSLRLLDVKDRGVLKDVDVPSDLFDSQ